MNETPQANRTHIAFFGRRNSGKSSLVNAVTGQNLAIVSDLKGTTTDPVYKAMELLPLGPVVIIDTPGFDDEGELGEMRVGKTKQVLNKTDIAVLVTEQLEKSDKGLETREQWCTIEEELIALFKAKKIPYITVLNKCDLINDPFPSALLDEILPVSAKTNFNINLLKEKIASLAAQTGLEKDKKLVADLIKPNDLIILVIPIDKAAPKGRLILPQQQMIRDILEAGAVAISVKEDGLRVLLEKQNIKPSLVITDSQVFEQAAEIVPKEIPLTSFSILFARYKGFLDTAVKGALALNTLQNKDKILICEGCTHHRQCDDIGTVKIPSFIKARYNIEPEFTFYSGGDFPSALSSYKLIIHCGACMLNEREMLYRRNLACEQNIPFTNYGTTIAHIKGILDRSIEFINRKNNE